MHITTELIVQLAAPTVRNVQRIFVSIVNWTARPRGDAGGLSREYVLRIPERVVKGD